MDTFDCFKERIQDLITKAYELSNDDINYIVLTDLYWISFPEFLQLNRVPKVWDAFNFKQDQFGEFDGVPITFKIVLKDYRWIEYVYCWSDSKFVMLTPPRRPQRKYVQRKEPHTRIIGDFIKSTKPSKINELPELACDEYKDK